MNRDIAIVGMSVLLPKINSLRDFWRQTNTSKNVFQKIPHWNHHAFQGICGAQWGGFLQDIVVNIEELSVSGEEASYIEPRQLLVLEAVRRAIADVNREINRQQTSVILACGSNSGELRSKYETSCQLLQQQKIVEDLPRWSQHSYVGSLNNIISGRVAYTFDLQGKNFVVDACCASSLATVDLAIAELLTGDSEVVVTGGVDTLTAYEYLGLDKTKVLSHTGKSRSFSSDADGSVISEGAAILILKRLEQALTDKNNIYALIKAVGGSSDGRSSNSLTLPSTSSQIQALSKAWKKSGVDPRTVTFIEGHGNATKIGDATESETIVRFLQDCGNEKCALSTCKVTLGHTRAIAGTVGIIRAALALKHKIIPLHAQQKNLFPIFNNPNVYLPANSQTWFSSQQVRRAGVNAFGFGGTNYHVVMEEYPTATPIYGGQDWPWELFLFSANSKRDLWAKLQKLTLSLDVPIAEIAYACCEETESNHSMRLAILACDHRNLQSAVQKVIAHLEQGSVCPTNAFLNHSVVANRKIAFLFSGQGSQYLNMANELCCYLPGFRAVMDNAPVNTYIFAQHSAAKQDLQRTEITQPALAAVCLGYMSVLRDLHIIPSAVAGHSFGELTALHAAQVFDDKQYAKLANERGKAMAQTDAASMLFVRSDAKTIHKHIQSNDLFIANYNTPQQHIVAGPKKALDSLQHTLSSIGIAHRYLNVNHAFHTPMMETARSTFAKAIDDLNCAPPQISVYSNINAQVYTENIKETLNQQITAPVYFADMVQQMAKDGVDIFLEVGPRNILCNMVKEICTTPVFAVDSNNKGDIYGFLQTVAQLYIGGVDIKAQALFTARQLRDVSFDLLSEEQHKKDTWFVNGNKVWKKKLPMNKEILEYFQSQHREKKQETTAEFENSLPSQKETTANSVDAVMLSYQKTMQQFLQSQQEIMSLYLQQGKLSPASQTSQLFSNEHVEVFNIAQSPNFSDISQEVTPPLQCTVPEQCEVLQTSCDVVSKPASSIEDTLLQIVADKTGYPRESLSAEQMIAEELGIDSIKKVEIFQALEELFPVVKQQNISQALFSAQTLSDVIHELQTIDTPKKKS